MRSIKILFTTAAVFSFIISGFTETAVEKGTRLMKINDDRPVFERIKSEITLNIYSSSGKLRFKKKLIFAAYTRNMGTKNEVEHYLAYFKAPADDKGNSYLAHNYKTRSDVKYVYLKGIRKAKKVTGADRRLSFFGSDFTNDDGGKPDFYEWNYKYLGDEKVKFKGKYFDCYKVESLPKTKKILRDTGYARKVTYIEKKTTMTLKLEYFDENITKSKELRLLSFTIKKNKKGQRVYYESGIEMKNVKRGSRSTIIFSNYKFENDANIRTDIFTMQYLTRKWW